MTPARLGTVRSRFRASSRPLTPVAAIPVGQGSQGASFDYACDQCAHGFTLLSRKRRAWLWYGVVVGLLMGGFALFGEAVGLLVAVLGLSIGLSMGGWLLFDSSRRRKSEP